MKIRPVGVMLFHADRHTDMTKLIGAFRDYTIAHYNMSSKKFTRSTFAWPVAWTTRNKWQRLPVITTLYALA